MSVCYVTLTLTPSGLNLCQIQPIFSHLSTPLKVHKHEIFLNTFFAETETIWSQGPVTRDF